MSISESGSPDPQDVKAYSFNVWNYKQGEVVSLMIHLGDQLGLYRALAGAGPLTAREFAAKTQLDELQKQYVITARAKGLGERWLIFKYPVRIAINPMISTIGWLLPAIISGATIVAIVLNLPTTGPMMLDALMQQDMYLAGSILLILSLMTVFGTVMSDILLVYLDPRIRYGGVGK